MLVWVCGYCIVFHAAGISSLRRFWSCAGLVPISLGQVQCTVNFFVYFLFWRESYSLHKHATQERKALEPTLSIFSMGLGFISSFKPLILHGHTSEPLSRQPCLTPECSLSTSILQPSLSLCDTYDMTYLGDYCQHATAAQKSFTSWSCHQQPETNSLCSLSLFVGI